MVEFDVVLTKDNSYRDVIKVDKKYSIRQIEYFVTEPKDRKKLISIWLNEENIQQIS